MSRTSRFRMLFNTASIDQHEVDVDAGLVAPPNRIGDFVWSDTNRNGVQDVGEPDVPGAFSAARTSRRS